MEGLFFFTGLSLILAAALIVFIWIVVQEVKK